MSWSPGMGVNTSIGLGVGYKEPVDLQVDRSNGTASGDQPAGGQPADVA
jgi:hypothetical protein